MTKPPGPNGPAPAEASPGGVAGLVQPFDPWTATEAQAQAAEQVGADDSRWPLNQWHAARWIEDNREQILQQGGRLLMRAAVLCLERGLVAPPWLAQQFAGRVRSVERLQAPTWDSAFGAPWPKGFKWASHRDRNRWARVLHALACDFVRTFPDKPLDQLLQAMNGNPQAVGLEPEFERRARSIPYSERQGWELLKAIEAAGFVPIDRVRAAARAEVQKRRRDVAVTRKR